MRDLGAFRKAYEGATPAEIEAISTGASPTKNSGSPFEPIKISSDAANPAYKYVLEDGRHRMSAAREAGAKKIVALIDGKRVLIDVPR